MVAAWATASERGFPLLASSPGHRTNPVPNHPAGLRTTATSVVNQAANRVAHGNHAMIASRRCGRATTSDLAITRLGVSIRETFSI
jgi:hypothetical protein